ncbi:HD-GYP domain-containing protein [Pseudomonas sp. GCM10022186]|uniref:HD-GYP domain-containing protein n=1 Tax=Pseudomonas sp. GCM10022186 TaxID=3252650 RepID=UPI003608E9CC
MNTPGYRPLPAIPASAIHPLLKSLYLMAALVEARDAYTGGHLWRVSQFSQLLAVDLGLPPSEVARITLGGFLHDLGKIGVPDAVLNKPGRLDEHEYEIMRTHPEVGQRLLSGHPLAVLVLPAVLMHHETPDGRGYPQGLRGEAIPLEARIVGVSDAFDAMTSTRPYRRAMPIASALDIIAEYLGSQFDRECGEHLITLGERGALDHIIGHSEPHIPLQACPECGPIIVVRHSQPSGSLVYCRACGGEHRVERDGDHVRLVATGRLGNAVALEPDADDFLLEDLLEQAENLLGVAAPGPYEKSSSAGTVRT